nr:MAG TPA: hypothetical protein [Caudoviricetes sp.]
MTNLKAHDIIKTDNNNYSMCNPINLVRRIFYYG